MLRPFLPCVLDFFDERHEHLAIRHEVLGGLLLFSVRGTEGSAFLERELAGVSVLER
jgi:hypothetical protein